MHITYRITGFIKEVKYILLFTHIAEKSKAYLQFVYTCRKGTTFQWGSENLEAKTGQLTYSIPRDCER